MKQCTICAKAIEREDAAVLVMSHYGNPKLLCDECEGDILTATTDRDFNKIIEAMERIGKRVSDSPTIDGQSYDAVKDILETSGRRAAAIRDGNYDFSLDEAEPEDRPDELDEIPEELKETEEDAELDRKDEEFDRKFNMIFTWISIILFGVAGVFIIYRLLDMLVF